MWAIMYTDNKLVEVDYTNAYEFDSYDKIGTFEEGKEILVDYCIINGKPVCDSCINSREFEYWERK